MNRTKQCEEVDRCLRTLSQRNSGLTPEAFERGRALISALGSSWVEIARAAGDGGATVAEMANWESMYAEAYREITLAAIAQNEAEARLNAA